MIPFPLGAWVKPVTATGGSWTEDFSSFDVGTQLIDQSGPAETGTPVVTSGTLKFGCAQSGDNNYRSWYARFADSPSVSDFELTFDMKIRNPDYGLGWYSQVALHYRMNQAQTGGVTVGWPYCSTNVGNGMALVMRAQASTAWGIACKFDHYYNTGLVGGSAFASSTTLAHDAWCTYKLTVSDNTHELRYWDGAAWQLLTSYTQTGGYTASQYKPASIIGIGAYTLTMFSNNYDQWIDNISMTY